MYYTIMVPIDLAHTDLMQKALGVSAGLARQFHAEIQLVGVTATEPTVIAQSPTEYRHKLEQFAAECSDELQARFNANVLETHDPVINLDGLLQRAATDLDADLIVMASHVPHFGDWLKHSHASWLAAHTDRSIFIVR